MTVPLKPAARRGYGAGSRNRIYRTSITRSPGISMARNDSIPRPASSRITPSGNGRNSLTYDSILGTEGFGGREATTPGWTPNLDGFDRIRTINVGQLYDLEKDPYERSNHFKQQPEIVAALRERLEKIVLEDRSRALD
jgi:hypothetical protein